MQTREDIEKWERGLEAVKIIITEKGNCRYVPCRSCPFNVNNNGHNLACGALGLKELVPACTKYLKGDITFVDGKLVEVED